MTYHVRAYATNNTGTSYGDEITFTTYKSDAIQDADGNYYNIVTIGNQAWLAENLRTTKYNDDTDIPLVNDPEVWQTLATPAYTWYDYDEAGNKNIYGGLYNWYTVNTGKICPAGWHVPGDEEWKELEMFLGMSQEQADAFGSRGTNNEGGRLKETGMEHWLSPNTGATDEFVYTALPGGNRDISGIFYLKSYMALWWSSSLNSSDIPIYRGLSYNDGKIERAGTHLEDGFSVRCLKDPGAPTVTTKEPRSVTKTSAESGGIVKIDGGSPIISRGVCWSISPNPTVNYSTYTVDGSDRGEFSSQLTGLLPGTPYYLRAYATNISGTGYGEEIILTTYKPDAIQDIDGNFYNQITIGSQTWLEENLRVTRFTDGTPIENLSDSATWVNSTGPAYCWYDNDSDLKDVYGALYNWNTVSDEKLCPAGWHVPTDVEWLQLETYLGMDPAEAERMDAWRGTTEGNKLKEEGTEHWYIPNSNENNESGFTALPAGWREGADEAKFSDIRQVASFWTSTEFLPSQVIFRGIDNLDGTIYRASGDPINAGLSVRCIRNDDASQVIILTEGWNILSFAASPADMSMASIVEPLIASMHFNKLQDESGRAVEHLSDPIGWINEIGQMSVTEGYKIRVEGPVSLTVTGQPASLPIDIPLETGWNIIGYPSMTSQSASSFFGPLISAGSLMKVQNEYGSSIEQIEGEWIYGFENLAPGEGYRVKTGFNTTLTVAGGLKGSVSATDWKATVPVHFRPSYTGNGLDHMNIFIEKPERGKTEVSVGDEIAIYDGDLCVGAVVVNDEAGKYFGVIASFDDPVTLKKDGFTEGSTISLRFWDVESGDEKILEKIEMKKGKGLLFERLGTLVLKSEFVILKGTFLGDAYPNPSDEKTTFTFGLASESDVKFEIYNSIGEKIVILLSETLPEGSYQIEWDNCTDAGHKVKAGVYFYKLSYGVLSQTKRLVIR